MSVSGSLVRLQISQRWFSEINHDAHQLLYGGRRCQTARSRAVCGNGTASSRRLADGASAVALSPEEKSTPRFEVLLDNISRRKLPDACFVCREQIGDQNAIDLHAGQIGVCDRGIREIDAANRDL